jgi:polysaccharide chain length determinant protein (PEP-CTERM system associated)
MRRKWYILLPLSLGLAAAPTIAKRIPELYRSETLIMVVPQRVPDEFVKPTVTGSVEDRLATINDVILSRSRLERIINDFDLYKEQRATGLLEDVIQRMRDDITVDVQGRQSFMVAFASRDPVVAKNVTTRLASLYIDENEQERERLAESTSLFLESQLEEAKERLVEHEKKLESYRKQFSGELPTQINSMFQSIQSAQLRLQSNAEAMNRLRERRLLIERQIGDLELAAPDSKAVEPPSAQALATAEDQLKQLMLRYTPDHPNVRAAQRGIADLKAQVEAARTAPPSSDPPPAEEVARRKKIEELKEDIAIVDRQLNGRESEETAINQSIQGLQTDVAGVPTRESELVELTRDYGTLQATYTSLLAKRQESKLAENLERRQVGERFRVLDEATVPQRPFNQRERLAWTAAGPVVGFVLGLLLAAFMELRDSSFKNEDEVMSLLSLPVLALVPVIASERERRLRRVRLVAMNVAGTLVVIASLTLVIVWQFQP